MDSNDGLAEFIPIDAIPEISGLDTVGALHRMAGNKKLYQKILRKFYTTQKDSAELIRSHLKESNLVEAEMIAHTVKGVAANVGYSALEIAAGELNQALKTNEPATEISSLLDVYERTLNDFTNQLKAFFGNAV